MRTSASGTTSCDAMVRTRGPGGVEALVPRAPEGPSSIFRISARSAGWATCSRASSAGVVPRAGAARTTRKGDVVVVLQVEPDRFFRREGLDIACTVPVNLAQALLGSKIKVKTLDGRRVVLKIPPGTQPGQKFRIAGQGIEKNGRRGDQYVEVHVDIPEHLTPEQEVALKAFAERSGMRY